MTKNPMSKSTRSPLLVLVLAALLTLVAACQTMPKEVTPPARPAVSAEEISAALAQAQATLSARRYKLAQRQFLRILAEDPQNLEAKMGLAEVFLAIGEPSKAAGMFRDLGGVDALRAEALQGEGIALLAGGHRIEARERLEEAAAAGPDLWRAWNALGRVYDYDQRWEDSRQCYDKALELKPDSAILHNNKGVSLLLQGKYEEASRQLMKALELGPHLATARANLRLALAWQGRYVEATGGLERGETPRVLNNIGYVALLRGDYERAEALLTRAMEASPSYFDLAARNLDTVKAMKAEKEAPDAVARD